MCEHTRDGNNRVAGNAVFGLHILGNEKAIPSVLSMATLSSLSSAGPPHGPCRESEIRSLCLRSTQMIKDDNPGVRRAALRALIDIHQEGLKRPSSTEDIG